MATPRRAVQTLAACVFALTATLAVAPRAAAASILGCQVPTVSDRCESWSTVYDDPTISHGSDQLEPRIAIAPDGSRVYVAVIDEQLNSSDPYNSPASWVVLAYDAHTGAQLWTDTYQSSGHYDRPNAIAVSPDGASVYVTGGSYNAPVLEATNRNLVTIAYDSSTGTRRWLTRNPVTADDDVGTAVVVSPDSARVYVTSNIEGHNGEIDWAAVAYSGGDGTQLWRTEYTGVVAGGTNSPAAMAISHDGSLVYITGESSTSVQYDLDYATVAYVASGPRAGDVAWTSRYDGVGQNLPDRPSGMSIDPDGRVVITGDSIASFSPSVEDDYATVAYDGSSGAQLWASRYRGPTNGAVSFGMAVATSPAADVAVVTGQVEPSGRSDSTAWETLAYDTSSGAQLWDVQLNTPGDAGQFPIAVAVTPDGNAAIVSGYCGARGATPLTAPPSPGGEAVTVAYATTTGAQQWIGRYTAATTDSNTPRDLAIGPDGSVFTTLQVAHDMTVDTSGTGNQYDVATVGYLATPPVNVPEAPLAGVLLLPGATAAGLLVWRRRRTPSARGVQRA